MAQGLSDSSELSDSAYVDLRIRVGVVRQWAKDALALQEMRRIDSLRVLRIQAQDQQIQILEQANDTLGDSCRDQIYELADRVATTEADNDKLRKQRNGAGGAGLVLLILLIIAL